MQNFWKELPQPFFILAPMEDVTDTVFRQIIMRCGGPDVFFTEFTNVEGMFSPGEKLVTQRLQFDQKEQPMVAQIWGLDPKHFYEAAKKINHMGFSGIDLNMGCPEKSVISRGACSALIENQTLAKEIILATHEGAGGLPISVKTRIGFKTNKLDEWIGFLLEMNLAALTIHGRTQKEMSAVPAHWDQIGRAVQLRNDMKSETLVIGNGDISSFKEGLDKVAQYGVDGIMIGRGIFTNPWIFNPSIDITTVSIEQRLQLLIDHVSLYEKIWEGKKHYPILKKFFKIYVSEFSGASHLRAKLMETSTADEAIEMVSSYLTEHTSY